MSSVVAKRPLQENDDAVSAPKIRRVAEITSEGLEETRELLRATMNLELEDMPIAELRDAIIALHKKADHLRDPAKSRAARATKMTTLCMDGVEDKDATPERLRVLLSDLPASFNLMDVSLVRTTPLHRAAFLGKTDLIRVLLDDEHMALSFMVCDGFGTPLHHAIVQRKNDAALMLLNDPGIFDLNTLNCNGNTPLVNAISYSNGDTSVVEAILNHKRNPDPFNVAESPILHAFVTGNLLALELLLAHDKSRIPQKDLREYARGFGHTSALVNEFIANPEEVRKRLRNMRQFGSK